MKLFATLFVALAGFLPCFGQDVFYDLAAVQPPAEFDNIHVEKLGTDKNSTTFVIWVKEEVKPHYHENRTETLYVLDGNGIMVIGDESKRIGAGNMFIIPKGTVHSVEVSSDTPLKVLSIQAPEFLGKDRHFTEGE